MSGMNKAIIIGNVGADPETRPVGDSTVANFSIATSEKFKDRAGDQKERTEWHRIVAWGKLAEIVGKYVKRGSQVAIVGKIQTREYEKDGQKRYSTEIIATELTLLGKPPERSNEAPAPQQDTQRGIEHSQDEIPF